MQLALSALDTKLPLSGSHLAAAPPTDFVGAGCYNNSEGWKMDFCKLCKKELTVRDKDGVHRGCQEWINKLESDNIVDLFPEIPSWPKRYKREFLEDTDPE